MLLKLINIECRSHKLWLKNYQSDDVSIVAKRNKTKLNKLN